MLTEMRPHANAGFASDGSRLADPPPGLSIAVLIPCFNEEVAIAKVVADFRADLRDAAGSGYVYTSSDGTGPAARLAGATVCHETLQGKGNVLRRMFADIDADAYVLVDGDDTYDARSAPAMLNLLAGQR